MDLHRNTNWKGLLLDFYSRRSANVVLPLAVEKGRQVIDLNHAHVEVLTGMHVQAAAEGHRKRGVTLHLRNQGVIKLGAHVRDPEQSVHKRRYSGRAPVVTRAGHKIVTLHPGIKGSPRPLIEITARVVSPAEAGHDSEVAGHILIELDHEAV